MLDIQFIRENRELVEEAAKEKQIRVDVGKLLKLDDERRKLISETENLQAKRNKQANEFRNTKPTLAELERGKSYKEAVKKAEQELDEVRETYLKILKQVPNIPLKDVPKGQSEADNIVAKTVGKPRKFDFAPKNHWEIAQAKDWIDKDRAAKVAGARFAYIKGDLAKLHLALINWAISVITDQKTLEEIAKKAKLKISSKPFILVFPPLMVKTDIYDAMDRLEPRDDRYKIEDEDLWLQGSAEHVLGSMHVNEVIDEKDLPLRYVGYATSFRKEAGTYGKDMEGIFRLHQFDKLEMESLTTNEKALNEHFFMIAIQEYLMQQLELPYQVIIKCTADIGKPNARGVDIDAWLPGQNKYRETHTADYMTDYQARRLKTRVRISGEQPDYSAESIQYVHTNDATVFSQRPLIAIIENYQTKDGRVGIPKVLQPYMGGRKEI